MKTTGQQSRVARHSAPAWVLELPLPPLPSLRDVPSGLASGRGSEGNMLSVGCGWRRPDRLPCQLCVGKREVPLPAGPHRMPAAGRVTETLATAPYPAGHFPFGALGGEARASSPGGSDPRRVFMDLGSGPWRSPH